MIHTRVISLTVSAAIVSTLLSGCQQTHSQAAFLSLPSNTLGIQAKQAVSDIANDAAPVTREDFLTAVKTLKTPYEQQNELVWDEDGFDRLARSIDIDNGSKICYEAVWVCYQGTRTPFVIFKKDGSKNIPVYFSIPGRDIISVKQLHIPFEEKLLVEIISYSSPGMSGKQSVEILAIDGDNVKSVWEFNEIESNTQVDIASGIEMKTVFTATHAMLRSNSQLDTAQKGYPAILVDETFNTVFIKHKENNKEEVIKSEKKTRQKIFLWDEQLGWFGNEKVLIGEEPPAITHKYKK